MLSYYIFNDSEKLIKRHLLSQRYRKEKVLIGKDDKGIINEWLIIKNNNRKNFNKGIQFETFVK